MTTQKILIVTTKEHYERDHNSENDVRMPYTFDQAADDQERR